MFTDFLDTTWNTSCMGCGIGDHSVVPPFGLIYESDCFVIHQDPLIPLEGFVLLASKRHISSIKEMTQEEYRNFSTSVWNIRSQYPESPELRYLTLIQEERGPHFHFWFFPWYIWMKTNSQPLLSQIRDISRYIQDKPVSQKKFDRIKDFIEKLRLNLLKVT